jgi:hypothetical protein
MHIPKKPQKLDKILDLGKGFLDEQQDNDIHDKNDKNDKIF